MEDIVGDAPVFHKHADALFEIPVGLFTKSVLDFVAIDEVSRGLGHDDHEGASYLVGLAQRFEVLIIRFSTDGEPEAHAVLPGVVDWGPIRGIAHRSARPSPTTRRPGIRWRRSSRPMKGGAGIALAPRRAGRVLEHGLRERRSYRMCFHGKSHAMARLRGVLVERRHELPPRPFAWRPTSLPHRRRRRGRRPNQQTTRAPPAGTSPWRR